MFLAVAAAQETHMSLCPSGTQRVYKVHGTHNFFPTSGVWAQISSPTLKLNNLEGFWEKTTTKMTTTATIKTTTTQQQQLIFLSF